MYTKLHMKNVPRYIDELQSGRTSTIGERREAERANEIEGSRPN